MSNQLSCARTALLLVLLFVIIPGSTVGAGLGEGEFPELVPDDPAAIYIWNVPLKLVLLDFVFMIAPLLFLPVQILISVLAWLCLGHRRISRKNALEHDTRRAAYLCIQENPGINHASLSHRLGINIGTLRYHLATLCETGQIVTERDHGQLRYHANGRAAREGEGYPINGTQRDPRSHHAESRDSAKRCRIRARDLRCIGGLAYGAAHPGRCCMERERRKDGAVFPPPGCSIPAKQRRRRNRLGHPGAVGPETMNESRFSTLTYP